ncbi:MAG: phosphoribosyltransferase [Microbacteriaceae bacterium]|nr:phosphoribosyltransferase [Microbacteriaceae bacterium]
MTLHDALSVLWPVRCAGCGADDRALCGACRAALSPKPTLRELPGLPVVAALEYDGVTRAAILALKEHGRRDIVRVLGSALGAAIAATAARAGGRIELVAMPTRAASWRRRGYDPVRELVSAAGHRRPTDALAVVASRDEQKTLGRSARAENLAGTIGARGGMRGRRVLLVDDVVTTGATLLEAARALRAADAEVVGAAVLASTPRLFGQSQAALGQTRDIPRLRV